MWCTDLRRCKNVICRSVRAVALGPRCCNRREHGHVQNLPSHARIAAAVLRPAPRAQYVSYGQGSFCCNYRHVVMLFP